MATATQSTAAEDAPRTPIGWDGKTSTRCSPSPSGCCADTGAYYGLDRWSSR